MNTRYVYTWETVAVTALPGGWQNLYRFDDGAIQSTLCPAILLQENRAVTQCWDEPQGDHMKLRTHVEPKEPPYETRAVFADYDYDSGELSPVNDSKNYLGTIGPGQTLASAGFEKAET